MHYSVLSGDDFGTWTKVAGLIIDLGKLELAQFKAFQIARQAYEQTTNDAEKNIYYNQLLQIVTEAGALKQTDSQDKTKNILVYSGIALAAVLLSFFLTAR